MDTEITHWTHLRLVQDGVNPTRDISKGLIRMELNSGYNIYVIWFYGFFSMKNQTRRISNTCAISVLINDWKCNYIFMFPGINLARQGLLVIMALCPLLMPMDDENYAALPSLAWQWVSTVTVGYKGGPSEAGDCSHPPPMARLVQSPASDGPPWLQSLG